MRALGGPIPAAALLVWAMVFTAGVRADCPPFAPGRQVGTVAHSPIDEASGIVASRKNPGVLWVHNDSGGSARAFAMNTLGVHLGIYNILGAGAWDWEDIAAGPGPVAGESYLFLGDIGDNAALRPSIVVYRVAEPAVSSTQAPVTANLIGAAALRLQYPDGARDAEVLMIDPLSGDLYVVSKREARSRIYRAPYPQSTTATTTMEFRGELTWGWTTGGDICPDGDEILIRGYVGARLWQRPPGTTVWDAAATAGCAVPLVIEPQGEAIGFDADGMGYYTVSEGSHQAIYYFERVADSGDANRDGSVNVYDLAILANHYGLPGDMDWGDGDFNTDDTVNVHDLAILANHYGTTAGVAAEPVPEPATILIVTAAGLPMLLKRRRNA